MRSFAARVLLLTTCTALACNDARPKRGDEAAQVEAEPAAPTPEAPPRVSTSEALLAWLDPDAVAILYADLPPELDTDAFAVIFALPPKLERMLRDVTGLDASLRAILPRDAPDPSTWLDPEALATLPRIGTDAYVLRRMSAPASVVQARLESAGMQATTIEGYTVLVPERLFPWKVAIMDEHVLAFVPADAMSPGLRPLTAARDYPPSEPETQLRNVFADEGEPVLELYGAGPLLHLDLDQELAQLMLQARPLQRGLDVRVQLVPARDVEEAAIALRERDISLEPDQIQALARRVAFSVEGPTVEGRLQMTANDLANLRRAG